MRRVTWGPWELDPGAGLGPIRLGMTRSEVRGLLGKGARDGAASERFCKNSLLVEYRASRVAFTQVSAGGPIRPTLFGVDVFSTPAKQVLARLRRRRRVREPEPGCLYVSALGVALWREADPAELAYERRSLDKKVSDYAEQARFYENEIRRFQFFQTAATFVAGYYGDEEEEPTTVSLAYPIEVTRNQNPGADRTRLIELIAHSRGKWKRNVVEAAKAELSRMRKARSS